MCNSLWPSSQNSAQSDNNSLDEKKRGKQENNLVVLMGDDSGGTYLTTSIIKLNLDVSSVLIYEIITKNMTSIKKNKIYIFK